MHLTSASSSRVTTTGVRASSRGAFSGSETIQQHGYEADHRNPPALLRMILRCNQAERELWEECGDRVPAYRSRRALTALLHRMSYRRCMTAHAKHAGRHDPLNQAFVRLERMLPAAPGRALHWLHAPESRFVRIPLGILCIIASFFWFLPIVGLELLPIGLLLIAQDVPFLREPVGRMMLWLLDRASRVLRWWKARRTVQR